MPMLADVGPEEAQTFVRSALDLVDVVEDHARCMAKVKANQIMVSLIRGQVAAAGT